MVASASDGSRLQKARVFIDFWNFQLSANDANGGAYRPDWQLLPRWLGTDAVAGVTGLPVSDVQYEGASVYLSIDPGGDAKLKDWATKFLDHVPGVTVVLKERVRRRPPVCQACHQEVLVCSSCSTKLALTAEKGVDVAIATDMIKLAWEDAYDWAVLVSSDRDFIPAVEFLNSKGRKVIHAGFPPRGSQLASKCWGSVDLRRHLATLQRTD